MSRKLLLLASCSLLLLAACVSEYLDDPAGFTSAPTPSETEMPGSDETSTSTPGSSSDDTWLQPVDTWRVTIERTRHGVPHVTANDLGSLAFGQGYAFAQDHVCTLADQMVQARSERSAWFGPGPNDSNIRSDLALLHLDVRGRAEAALQAQSEEALLIYEGYAAGFNHYLEEAGLDGLPEICRGEDWVQPISVLDLASYYQFLALLGSARQLLPFIAEAQPSSANKSRRSAPLPPMPDFRAEAAKIGSNGWGIGSERSTTGRGMVLGNPHFPWEGELRLHESHLTIPGHMNVYGASLLGVAGILIGFNEHVGWTHTVSFAPRFTAYSLTLDPEDEMRYRYDDEWREIEGQTYTIDVLQEDGTLAPLERTLYRSHYGPMLELDPLLAWNADGLMENRAITYRDANLENDLIMEQFFRMNIARSLDEFEQVNRDVGAVPWVNTMAASADGEAYYADSSIVPFVSEESYSAWRARIARDLVTGQLNSGAGVILLDGSTSDEEWIDDERSRIPGAVPYDEAPSLRNRTYIFNANDSHWLANVETPLVGYPSVYGPEETRRSFRTRMNAKLLTESGEDAFSDEEGRFSREALETLLLADRLFSAELMLDDILDRCPTQPTITVDGDAITIAPGCDVLADWDRRAGLDSPGAVLWRETFGSLQTSVINRGNNWRTAFDANDPIYTPRDFGPEDPEATIDPALRALATAMHRMDANGIDLDATLRDYQFTIRGGERIPIPGGLDREGAFQIIGLAGSNTTLLPRFTRGERVINSVSGLWDTGYPINYGGSFMMVLSFTDDGPRGSTLLSYSQSDDERTDWVNDQTLLFSAGEWKEILFDRDAIEADEDRTQTQLEVSRASTDE